MRHAHRGPDFQAYHFYYAVLCACLQHRFSLQGTFFDFLPSFFTIRRSGKLLDESDCIVFSCLAWIQKTGFYRPHLRSPHLIAILTCLFSYFMNIHLSIETAEFVIFQEIFYCLSWFLDIIFNLKCSSSHKGIHGKLISLLVVIQSNSSFFTISVVGVFIYAIRIISTNVTNLSVECTSEFESKPQIVLLTFNHVFFLSSLPRSREFIAMVTALLNGHHRRLFMHHLAVVIAITYTWLHLTYSSKYFYSFLFHSFFCFAVLKHGHSPPGSLDFEGFIVWAPAVN